MNLILLDNTDFIGPDIARLTGRRAQHLLTHVKVAPGKICKAGRLNGPLGDGEIMAVDDQSVTLRFTPRSTPPTSSPVTLLCALPRPKTFHKVVHTATVMGVKTMIFFESYKVDKSYWQSPMLTSDAIRDTVTESLEQGADTVMPDIRLIRRFKPFVEDQLAAVAKGSPILIAHPGKIAAGPVTAGPFTLVVGPEGGFTDYELNLLQTHGGLLYSLGPRILRTEFAVTALLARLI